jgi:DNA invertase Pin-like site-specific DNA recombinase
MCAFLERNVPVQKYSNRTNFVGATAGGRPASDIAPNEVYDALREGQTVTEGAKKFGISRASVYKLKEGMQFILSDT